MSERYFEIFPNLLPILIKGSKQIVTKIKKITYVPNMYKNIFLNIATIFYKSF